MQDEGYEKYNQMTVMRTERLMRPVPFGEVLVLSRLLDFSPLPESSGSDYKAGFDDGIAEAVRRLTVWAEESRAGK